MISESQVRTQPAESTHQLSPPLGSGRDLRRRLLLHHLPLAVASTLGLVVLVGLRPGRGGRFPISRLASPTGDVALVLLAVTLLIGPANLLLRRRNPINCYLRRDVGTWTAIWSIIHVIIGFQAHIAGAFSFVKYFIADGKPLANSFGWANWTGLAATVIVVFLLVISTDRYLRELKAKIRKDLQRLNYTLFALVVLHAVFYGALDRMTSPFTRILLVTVVMVLLGQVVGIWLWRRRHSRTAASQRERRPAGRFSGTCQDTPHAEGGRTVGDTSRAAPRDLKESAAG
jgi:sulfoxide reductase heme-binding subunit YedZ